MNRQSLVRFATITLMLTIRQRATFHVVVCHVSSLLAIFILVVPVLARDVLAQPTLKEVIEGKEQEKGGTETKAEGQKTDDPQPKTAPAAIAADEFDRGAPRASIQSFLAATRKGDYERAAHYLDLRRLPSEQRERLGPELARQLKIVLDRTVWIDPDLLSPAPEGNTADGLPPHYERLGRIESPGTAVDILLQRVARDDGTHIWQFAAETVAQTPSLYAHFGDGPVGEALSSVLPDFEFLGLRTWQWVGLVAIAALAYLAAWLVTALIAFFLRRREVEPDVRLGQFVAGPVRFLLWVVIGRWGVRLLGPSLTALAISQAQTLLVIGVTWTVMRLLDFGIERVARRLTRSGQTATIVLLPPLGTIAKSVVLLIAVIVWLDNVGFEVTTLLAGLGVGSIAVALAAQKTLEDLFGAVTLFTGQTVKVGDLCRFGQTVGTIEEIGLRTTRVRTLDRAVISVPNGQLASSQLENFAKRDKFWYHPRIGLRYETTPDQLRCILTEMRTLLDSHPKVLPDPARLRFVGFGASSLDLEVFAYLAVTDYGEFLAVAEDLNLRVMDVVAQAGSSFTFPSQTT